MIVDQDTAFRQRLRMELMRAPDILVVSYDDPPTCAPLDPRQADLILFGLGTDPARDLQNLARILRASPTRIIVFHRVDQEPLVLEALRLGLSAHLCKDELEQDDAVAAIRKVARGEVVLSARLAGRVLDEVQKQRMREEENDA